MKTIRKYDLEDITQLELPIGFLILSVQYQNNKLCLWALIDKTRQVYTVNFRIIGTESHFDPTNLTHIASVQKGEFVWHVFMENE